MTQECVKNKKCKHYGTMTLTPCEDKGWEVLDWCFYQRKAIIAGCPKDCPHKDKPVDFMNRYGNN